jgi:DNA-directed RNA polymerase subunit RPC12/RpoP
MKMRKKMTLKPERPVNRCEHCGWSYPTHYLNMMRTNLEEFNGKYVCGICALEITNQIHNVKRETFDGMGAESFRQGAIKWRAEHPYDDPAKRKK